MLRSHRAPNPNQVAITNQNIKQAEAAYRQASALVAQAKETALTIRQNRIVASVALIQALGGGWQKTLSDEAGKGLASRQTGTRASWFRADTRGKGGQPSD
jgi:hypothetical protein